MKAAWIRSWWLGVGLAPLMALLIVGGFSGGALVSRIVHSLALKVGLLDIWIGLLLLCLLAVALWILASVSSGLTAFFTPGSRSAIGRWILASGCAIAGCAVGLVLSPFCVHALGYPNERAVEALITEFDPVVVAIRSFESKEGHPPAALTELVPDYLVEVPRPQVLGDSIELRYERLEADWRLQADAYLMHGIATFCPLAELEYSGSQRYEPMSNPSSSSSAPHAFHGWRWYVDD